jgi:succinate dehydrogenase/fumarate reductase flavoprotein subunit
MGGISCAATYGWIAGKNSAEYARNAPPADNKGLVEEIDMKKEMIQDITSRKEGADWKEVNIAVQQLMQDYAGVVRSETMLRAGLSYLKRMRKKVDKVLLARNRWELSRCLETLNLMDIGELVFISALERKESRALHHRTDYPLTDPVMDGKEIVIRNENGKPIVELRTS